MSRGVAIDRKPFATLSRLVESAIVDANDHHLVSARIVTVPNVLSVLRLVLVPVFLLLLLGRQDFLALCVLVTSSFTDYLDGVIARRFNQISRLGQLLDPAADRLFIFATLIGLALRQVIPLWFVAVILTRDVLLAALGLVLLHHNYSPLPVHRLGKLATFCLFIALPLLMLGLAFPEIGLVTTPLAWASASWGAFLYWWGGVTYATGTWSVVRSTQSGAPVASDTLGRKEVHDGQI